MGLNIKNEHVHELARRLASMTGENMTVAIERALEERLERVSVHAEGEERLRRVEEILKRLPPPPPGLTSDHSDLYNEFGEFDDR